MLEHSRVELNDSGQCEYVSGIYWY